MNDRYHKRGQTAYVILGILVAVSILAVAFGKDLIKSSELSQQQAQAETVPQQAQKVKLFTESCLSFALKEGIQRLSQQGGHIDLPEDDLPRSPLNPFSNSIDVFNDGSLLVPFWYYKKANGVEERFIPTRETMEQELAAYLKTKTLLCLNKYAELKEEGYNLQPHELKPTVSIADEKVYLTADFPVEVEKEEFSYTIKKFYASETVPLGRLYKQATAIMAAEDEQTFLESYARDMIVTYEELPSSGVDFECTPKTWLKSKVIQDFKRVLEVNLPFIRVKGSGGQLTQAKEVYKQVSIADADPTITAVFTYSSRWPVALNLVGESGEIVSGKQFAAGTEISRVVQSLFCLNQYHFVYDLQFPALVQLSDDQGNAFQFGVLAVIQHNQPRENKFENIPVVDTSSVICGNTGGKVNVEVLATGSDFSLVPVPGAAITLKCLTTTCPLGTTTSDGFSAALKTDAPFCVNGLLIAEKEGYFRAEQSASTNEDLTIPLVLEPFYTLTIQVNVLAGGVIRPLQPTEKAIFTLRHLEKDFVASVVSSQDQATLQLIAGPYEITSQLIVKSNPPFRLEEQKIKHCADTPVDGVLGVIGVTKKTCTSQTIPAAEYEEVIAGGGTIRWTAQRQEIGTAHGLTLYTVRGNTPTRQSQLGEIDEMMKKLSSSMSPPRFEQ